MVVELPENTETTNEVSTSALPVVNSVDEEVEIPVAAARRTSDEPVKVASGDDTLSYFAKLASED